MRPERWSDRAAAISFWSLNLGLAWMSFANLFPVGIVQFHDALDKGYWHARSLGFISQRWVNALEWARLPGDVLFIVGGAIPLLWLCWRAVRYPNRGPQGAPADQPVQLFIEEPASPRE
jgi:nitric oxide reductase subunit B